MSNLWVNGIVSARDQQPYVQLSSDDKIICQLTMAEARKIAMDLLQMSSRTEADAMLIRFFAGLEFPSGAAAALMQQFRDFRAELDNQKVYGADDAEEGHAG